MESDFWSIFACRERTHICGARVRCFTPKLTPMAHLAERLPLGKVNTAEILKTKPLISRAQFLAGDTVPCPGDSLEAIGGNIFATRFAHAVSPTGTTRKRSLNFFQCSAAQIGSKHRHVLLNGPDGELYRVRGLHTGRKGLGFTPRGSQNFVALLQQETSIRLFWSFHNCTHTRPSFTNRSRRTSQFKVCPWIRMFQMIPRLHIFLKFFCNFVWPYFSIFYG